MSTGFDERLAEIADQLRSARGAQQAAGFITSEFLPLWWSAWREAFVRCPSSEEEELRTLRAEMRVVTAFEKQLGAWGSQVDELEVKAQELAAEAVEEWRTMTEPGEE